jgi:hypothetical protein
MDVYEKTERSIGWRSAPEKTEIPSASLRTGSSAAMKSVDVRDDKCSSPIFSTCRS